MITFDDLPPWWTKILPFDDKVLMLYEPKESDKIHEFDHEDMKYSVYICTLPLNKCETCLKRHWVSYPLVELYDGESEEEAKKIYLEYEAAIKEGMDMDTLIKTFLIDKIRR